MRNYRLLKCTLVFLPALLFSCIMIGQQQLSVSVDTSQNTATFTITGIPDQDPNVEDYGANPFYQMFFIFGDGNYYWRMGEMVNGSSYTTTHTFPNAIMEYVAVALAIDRKSDTPPPPNGLITNFQGNNPFTITPAQLTAPDTIHLNNASNNQSPALLGTITNPAVNHKRIRLDFSHFLEPGRWSSFIVAYHPIVSDFGDSINNVRLLFFLDDEIFYVANTLRTHKPNYHNGTPGSFLPQNNIKRAQEYGNRSASASYDTVIIYNIPQKDFTIDNTPNYDGYEELRLFHIMKSRPNLDTSLTYSFMAVLASTDRPDSKRVESNYLEDSLFLKGYVTKENKTFVNDANLYYLDADRILLKSGKPKDPNRLWVSNICELSDELFEVTFSLRFCNESRFPSSSANVYIKDCNWWGYFTCITSTKVQEGLGDEGNWRRLSDCMGGNGSNNPVSCESCQLRKENCSRYDALRDYNEGFCLSYNSISKGDRVLRNECRTFTFTTCVNKDGLKRLEEKGALRACVSFNETDCEAVCAFSEPINDEVTSNCQDDSPCEDCNVRSPQEFFRYIAAVLIAIAGMIGLIKASKAITNWRRKRKLKNTGES